MDVLSLLIIVLGYLMEMYTPDMFLSLIELITQIFEFINNLFQIIPLVGLKEETKKQEVEKESK